MIEETAAGLYCAAGDFHIDPWAPVPRAVITHAHGDHARAGHGAYLCAQDCAPLLRLRFGDAASVQSQPYGSPLTLGAVTVSFHPAGHMLGSAQVRVGSRSGVWVLSGDYKRARDSSCAGFEPVRCDTFITESTFALPVYRWEPPALVISQILEWWGRNRSHGLASVLFCYSLGKAQRLLHALSGATDQSVFVHGSLISPNAVYRAAGVRFPTIESVTEHHGAPLAGELILAPPSARGTAWMRRLGDYADAFVSGTMRIRGMRRQRGYDRGFVLSDHVDWPDLLKTIEETGAHRVLATHGYAEALARYLAESGRQSGVVRSAWEGEGGADA